MVSLASRGIYTRRCEGTGYHARLPKSATLADTVVFYKSRLAFLEHYATSLLLLPKFESVLFLAVYKLVTSWQRYEHVLSVLINRPYGEPR